MLDVKLLNGYSITSFLEYMYGFAGVIKTVLDGPISVNGRGRSIDYVNQWNDSEVNVHKAGGRVDRVDVKVDIPEEAGGRAGLQKVLEIDFGRGAPSLKRIKKGFEALHEDGDDAVMALFRGPFKVTDSDSARYDGGVPNYARGSEGNDRFFMKGGNDVVEGSDGKDRVFGGPGFDGMRYQDLDATGPGLELRSRKGKFVVDKPGAAGKDRLKDVEGVTGTNGDDDMRSKLRFDVRFDGTGGDDFLRTGRGDDTLIGGSGSDTLRGGKGGDVLVAGSGFGGGSADVDLLFGQRGADLFVIGGGFGASGRAVIRDFKNGQDVIGVVDGNFADLEFARDGRHTEISLDGQVIAQVNKTPPRRFDREDFYQDFEPGILLDWF